MKVTLIRMIQNEDNLSKDMESPRAESEGEQSSKLGDAAVSCEHFVGGSEFDGALRLRYIRKCNPEAYKQLENIREEVVGRYVREIMGESIPVTRKYASNVYIYRDDEHRNRMLRRLNDYAAGYPGKLLLWTDEESHLHIVHDCPDSNGQCRCYFQKSEDFQRNFRGPIRRRKYINEMDELDWSYVFLYFIMSKRESNSQVWIGGRLQRSPNSDESIRWRALQEKSREILAREDTGVRRDSLEEDRHSEDRGSFVHPASQEARKKRSLTEGDGGSTSGRPVPAKKTKFQRLSETVHSLLNEYFVLPANHIRDILVHEKYIENLYDPTNEKAYQASCDIFMRKFIKLKLHDLKELYENALPVFYANSIDPYEYYHDVPTSFKFIKGLLEHQYEGDEEKIKMFLTNVRDWFNLEGWERNPKVNAICVIGPPNSGKNYFWDMFSALAYNTGHIGRVNNKTNQFALQECYGRRLIVGNEISMEEGAKEDFKKLCEGTAFNIRVKYQGDKIFTRAPVILISNSVIDICNDRHFKDIRLHTMRWGTCSMLKDSNKKPYPLCLFNVFDHYGINV